MEKPTVFGDIFESNQMSPPSTVTPEFQTKIAEVLRRELKHQRKKMRKKMEKDLEQRYRMFKKKFKKKAKKKSKKKDKGFSFSNIAGEVLASSIKTSVPFVVSRIFDKK
jgi:ribosome-binding ATPase YchF (GTP1/OBG family)